MKPKILQDIDDLKVDVLDLEKSQLVGKYYVPIVAKEIISQETYYVNPMPTTSWTGTYNWINSGGYTVETSSAMASAISASQLRYLFNDDNADSLVADMITNSDISMTITLPEAIRLISFSTYIITSLNNLQITLSGSNDKINWKLLTQYTERVNNQSGFMISVESNIDYYKYYKLSFILPSGTASRVTIREFQLRAYNLRTYGNSMTVEGIPTKFEDNQRIMIKTPNHSNAGIVSNTLNGKSIDKLLLPERFYELVYDGSKYLAKEVV